MIPRRRKCPVCKLSFSPTLPNQATCWDAACALVHARRLQAKEFKLETQRRREAIMTVSDWEKTVQQDFNRFIRFRDYGKPCVSCGATKGQMQAGHYRPKLGPLGVPALRYNEVNCHAQCSRCNDRLSGNRDGYRDGLILRLGFPISLVEWLDADHPAPNWTIGELKQLKRYYQAQALEAKKLIGETTSTLAESGALHVAARQQAASPSAAIRATHLQTGSEIPNWA